MAVTGHFVGKVINSCLLFLSFTIHERKKAIKAEHSE